jgi:hypothetical protein
VSACLGCSYSLADVHPSNVRVCARVGPQVWCAPKAMGNMSKAKMPLGIGAGFRFNLAGTVAERFVLQGGSTDCSKSVGHMTSTERVRVAETRNLYRVATHSLSWAVLSLTLAACGQHDEHSAVSVDTSYTARDGSATPDGPATGGTTSGYSAEATERAATSSREYFSLPDGQSAPFRPPLTTLGVPSKAAPNAALEDPDAATPRFASNNFTKTLNDCFPTLTISKTGHMVTLIGSATSCTNPFFLYMYSGWGIEPQPKGRVDGAASDAAWTAGPLTFDERSFPSGPYIFTVFASESINGPSQGYYDQRIAQLGPGCTELSVAASPSGTQQEGTPIIFTASATCDPGSTPEYSFRYSPPSSPEASFSGATQDVWQAQPQATLDTTGFFGGSYWIQVRARRAGNTVGWAESWFDINFDLDDTRTIPTDKPLVERFESLNVGRMKLAPGWRVDSLRYPNALGTFSGAISGTGYAAGPGLAFPASSDESYWPYRLGAGSVALWNSASPPPATDWAPGWATSDSTKSGNLYIALRAPADKDLTGLDVGYDIEKYKSGTNPAGFRLQLFTSLDGGNWTSAGSAFRTVFPADSTNDGFDPAPGAFITVPRTRLNASIPRNTRYYLAWNYSLNSPSAVDGGNAQALGIDNVSLKGEAQCVPSCAGKTCGDDLSDGCGGTCTGICGAGESGCVLNSDCGANLRCASRSPDPGAAHVCVPPTCTSACTPECPCTGGSGCSADNQCGTGFTCPNGVCINGSNACV